MSRALTPASFSASILPRSRSVRRGFSLAAGGFFLTGGGFFVLGILRTEAALKPRAPA
ncbi:hypothetical protein PC123_g26654 [Phytophthora cactorum]|nr:hypothetical protein PC123_g26654 [Phytophthora cactorum]